ncbi:hypothetical protein [Streptosporangium sp. LJ11]|uniref:hypothetical protein n=1 Tax=Streptosporangium sp. LJ11 TaxID=3436927 RepID=UPI003F79E841
MTGTGLDGERARPAEREAVIRRMVEGARPNVGGGERVAGDRYGAERPGYHLRSLARELDEQPDGPPLFGHPGFA